MSAPRTGAPRLVTVRRPRAGESPPQVAHQHARTAAFHAVSPQAPVHVPVVPGRHVANLLAAPAAAPEPAPHAR